MADDDDEGEVGGVDDGEGGDDTFGSERDRRHGATMVFCALGCRAAWNDKYGRDGQSAFAAALRFLRTCRREEWWNDPPQCVAPKSMQDLESGLIEAMEAIRLGSQSKEPEDDLSLVTADELTEKAVDKAWSEVNEQVALIVAYRMQQETDGDFKDSVEMRERKTAYERALARPVIDADMLLFFLDGLFCRTSLIAWRGIESLSSGRTYDGVDELEDVLRSFLHLHCFLPLPILNRFRQNEAGDNPILSRETLERLHAISATNSFSIQDPTSFTKLGSGIWAAASLFNHACDPNVVRRREGRAWIFETNRNVSGDEELCISYLASTDGEVRRRRELLEVQWEFVCRCEKCRIEAGVSQQFNKTVTTYQF